MQDIPEYEARALLIEPRRCEDAPNWAPIKQQPGSFEIGVGVVDHEGKSTGLYVQLIFQRSYKTQIVRYRFTVFKRQRYGSDRVYQLQVNHFPRPVHDAHQRSHEHIGNRRVTGDAAWANWSYDDVIAYFCRQTNISFDPELLHPEHFRLVG